MSSEVIPGLIVGTVSLGFSALGFYGARRASSESAKARRLEVEDRAFKRAEEIYTNSIDELRAENKRLSDQIGYCRRRVDQLERALQEVNIPIPTYE